MNVGLCHPIHARRTNPEIYRSGNRSGGDLRIWRQKWHSQDSPTGLAESLRQGLEFREVSFGKCLRQLLPERPGTFGLVSSGGAARKFLKAWPGQ
jgi:hypothetical protein